MSADNSLKWAAEIECEYGGPVVIAAVDDYMRWNGAQPYPLNGRRTLHYWGQFTPELPSPYGNAAAGHTHRTHPDVDALVADRDALLSAVRQRFGDVEVTHDEHSHETRVQIEDGRSMSISLAPESPYDDACGGSGIVWAHSLGTTTDAQGLFWSKEGPGSFEVRVRQTRDELLLLRTWAEHDDGMEAARALLERPAATEAAVEGASLSVGERGGVVAHAPLPWLDLLDPGALDGILEDLSAGRAGREETQQRIRATFHAMAAEASPVAMLSAPHAPNSAATVALEPGVYAASAGHHDSGAGWSCIWSRLCKQPDG